MCRVAQPCLTLCDPMDYSPPGSSVHGDPLGTHTGVGCEPSSRGSSRPRNGAQSTALQADSLLSEPPGKSTFTWLTHIKENAMESLAHPLNKMITSFFSWIHFFLCYDHCVLLYLEKTPAIHPVLASGLRGLVVHFPDCCRSLSFLQSPTAVCRAGAAQSEPLFPDASQLQEALSDDSF